MTLRMNYRMHYNPEYSDFGEGWMLDCGKLSGMWRVAEFRKFGSEKEKTLV